MLCGALVTNGVRKHLLTSSFLFPPILLLSFFLLFDPCPRSCQPSQFSNLQVSIRKRSSRNLSTSIKVASPSPPLKYTFFSSCSSCSSCFSSLLLPFCKVGATVEEQGARGRGQRAASSERARRSGSRSFLRAAGAVERTSLAACSSPSHFTGSEKRDLFLLDQTSETWRRGGGGKGRCEEMERRSKWKGVEGPGVGMRWRRRRKGRRRGEEEGKVLVIMMVNSL